MIYDIHTVINRALAIYYETNRINSGIVEYKIWKYDLHNTE